MQALRPFDLRQCNKRRYSASIIVFVLRATRDQIVMKQALEGNTNFENTALTLFPLSSRLAILVSANVSGAVSLNM